MLVKRGATLDRQCLRHVDLDVADVVAVPYELEESVGEPQGQNVLHRLLPEEVVDSVHLRLVEDAVHSPIELAGRLQVRAERLLQDDPRPLVEPGRSKRVDESCTRDGWHGQVMQAPDISADRAFRVLDCGNERVAVADGRIRKLVGEPSPRLLGWSPPSKLGDRISREHPELVVGKGRPRRPNYAKAPRKKPGL